MFNKNKKGESTYEGGINYIKIYTNNEKHLYRFNVIIGETAYQYKFSTN